MAARAAAVSLAHALSWDLIVYDIVGEDCVFVIILRYVLFLKNASDLELRIVHAGTTA